jgi:hypothetical protein
MLASEDSIASCIRQSCKEVMAVSVRFQEVCSVSQVNIDPGGDRGSSGVNAVAVVAIVILVILAFLAIYFLFLGDDGDADINVDVGSPTTYLSDEFGG